MKRVWIVPGLIVIVAAGVAVAILLSYRNDRLNAENLSLGTQATPRERTFQTMLSTGTSAVYVEDQAAGSETVAIGFAVMESEGFVAIYDSEGGHPGKEIARSSLLPAGGGQHLTIPLGSPLLDGQIYYAVLLAKDGSELADPDANVILMSFAARAGAEPETGAVQP